MDSSNGKYLYVVSIGVAASVGPTTSLVGFQTSIGVEKALGSTNSIIFGAFLGLSAILLASPLAAALGRKNTLIFGEAGAIIYTLAMFYPTWWTLIPAAAMGGLSEAVVWTTSGAMVASIYRDQSDKEYGKRKKEQNIAIFNAIVAFGQAGSFLIAEAIFTWLQNSGEVDSRNATQTYNISQCGANDCPMKYSFREESAIFKNLIPSKVSTYVLLCIYGSLQIAVVVLHCTLLANNKTNVGEQFGNEAKPLLQKSQVTSILESFLIVPLKNVAKNLFSIKGMLTIPAQLQCGLLTTFVWSGFNRAFLSCTVGVEHLGSNEGVINLASFSSSLVLSFLARHFHPVFAGITAFLIELSSYIAALYWIPSSSNLYMTYVLSTLFGITYGMRRYVGLSTAAAQDLDAGYAIFGFAVGFSATLNYAWTTPLCVNIIIYILMSHSVFASVLLLVAHYKYL